MVNLDLTKWHIINILGIRIILSDELEMYETVHVPDGDYLFVITNVFGILKLTIVYIGKVAKRITT